MGNIASTTVATSPPELDGRFWVTETHVDVAGRHRSLCYLAEPATNAETVAAARAVILGAELQAAEVAENLAQIEADGSDAQISSVYSTAADTHAAARADYATQTELGAVQVGSYLASLSDVELEAAFGLNAAGVAALRLNHLTPADATATTISNTAGA